MEKYKNFKIKNGVLVEYTGNGGDVIIPEGITSIWEYAFFRCSSLTSIKIPSSVTSIGDYAFYGCSNLTNIEIPDGVMSIGDGAFRGCDSLNYTIEDNFKYLGNKNNPYLYLVRTTLKNIVSASINLDCKYISDYAFRGCKMLTNIKIPKNVTRIGSHAFEGCDSLKSVEIPENVKWICYRAFYSCSSLTNIKIPSGVTNIDYDAFEGCDNLVVQTIKGSRAEEYAGENDIPVEYIKSETDVLANW